MPAINAARVTMPSARERILLTAHDLFYQEGIRATGIDRVIVESGVTKATFYRHFPSKNDLILEFLEYRHQHWKAWFVDALTRYGSTIHALGPVLEEWLRDKNFRGCAFINSVGEVGGLMPAVVAISRKHKQDMTDIIASLLPPSRNRKKHAQALAMAVDGAIVRAQIEQSPTVALRSLDRLLRALVASRE